MRTVDLIQRKRNGEELSSEEIAFLIDGYTQGEIPDYQMAAFLMAVYFKGMVDSETDALTRCMLSSGTTIDLSSVPGVKVDKHSTGGVGDKTSLIAAPLAAAAGAIVPMISGRALGFTGGTLDKLESIPGFRTNLTVDEFREQLRMYSLAFMGQTPEVAPADGKLYALRDATATVESIPLIASSIMSKKLAEGLTGLVLDIKRGSGAFLPELARGIELAELMVQLGTDHDCPTVALITAMDRPLGRAIGNSLEVEEAIHTLKGEGPPDLLEVTYALGAEMLVLGGVADSLDAARRSMERAISSGAAAERFAAIIEAQGGNPGVVEDPAVLPQADACELFVAPRRGLIARIEPRAIGRGLTTLGGGRTKVDDR